MRDADADSVGHGALVRPPGGNVARAPDTAGSAIPDVLDTHLRVLFCGINPGRVSAAAAAHFANPRNDFWRLLHAARFTPRLLTPSEQWEALDYGVGITNAAHRTTPESGDLRSADFAGSAERLERFARECEPAWIGFVGKEAFRGAFGERPQLGAQSFRLARTRLFVLPSTSPANAAVPWEQRLHWFRELARASRPRVRPAWWALLLDRRNRVFLMRFVGPGEDGVWFTPGGAIERGETDEQALERELREELRLEPHHVERGPWVWTRRHVWYWPAVDRIYDTRERFAFVRVKNVRAIRPTAHDSLFAGPDAREEYRWWTIDELARTREIVAPRNVAQALTDLLAKGPPPKSVDVGR